MVGFEVYFGERNNRLVTDAGGVREREDSCEGVKEATAHTSLHLGEGYRAGDRNEQASDICMLSKESNRFLIPHGIGKRGSPPCLE